MNNKLVSLPCPRLRAGGTTRPTRRPGFLLLCGLGLLLSFSAGAQPGSGGPGPGTPTPPVTPTDVPIDGGASLLLAGGVGYALRRLRRARKA
ncbi:PID-CTERM protein-sorting domain-containing protein [Hymenobacter monticola]|uniref:VPDSG-CTERM sorting domain-containing protein n=1 Tax=Hymenobacter monticola TaxID=1705399 RepID=A0ABY4B6E1_9BACT|nr:hypothetical protein [Hymenobacter monticola]UOE34605.1 hypothetical protein MTP16_02880 [Hymenobacter monticola]